MSQTCRQPFPTPAFFPFCKHTCCPHLSRFFLHPCVVTPVHPGLSSDVLSLETPCLQQLTSPRLRLHVSSLVWNSSLSPVRIPAPRRVRGLVLLRQKAALLTITPATPRTCCPQGLKTMKRAEHEQNRETTGLSGCVRMRVCAGSQGSTKTLSRPFFRCYIQIFQHISPNISLLKCSDSKAGRRYSEQLHRHHPERFAALVLSHFSTSLSLYPPGFSPPTAP